MRRYLLALLFAAAGLAQSPADDGPRYDTRSMVDLKGTVGDVEDVRPPNRMSGVHLRRPIMSWSLARSSRSGAGST